MKNKLVLNSAEDAEIISVRLDPERFPIAYANKVECLMLSGLSEEEAKKEAMMPIDLELYYEVGVGLMAVEPGAVESGTIYSPYTRELYDNEVKSIGMWMWGDVKGYVLEKKVAFTKKYKDESREDEDCEEWEEVDSCWGCYEETDELIKEVMIENGLEE